MKFTVAATALLSLAPSMVNGIPERAVHPANLTSIVSFSLNFPSYRSVDYVEKAKAALLASPDAVSYLCRFYRDHRLTRICR